MAVKGSVVALLVISSISFNVASLSLDKALPEEAVQRYAKAAGLDEGGEYDVVYPKFSQRWKREATVDDDDVDDHVTVTAFGETYNLRLKRSDDFFVTPFVEYCGTGGIRSDWFPFDADKSCFYNGYITGVENSLVAVKSCNGDDVTGWLIGNYTLFLHPLKSQDLPVIDGHPHIALLVEENPTEELWQNDILIPKEQAKRVAEHERETRDNGNVPRPTYVELMVAVDKTAQEKLGKNTIPHVLAMVNMVGTAYKHPSSKDMNIHVRLVRLILIDDDKCKPYFNMADDVYDRLDNFAGWADAINVEDDDSPLHFDYGFLITEKDWVNSDVGGLAYRGTMCGYWAVGLCPISTSVSCFGHEMSHTLGLNHELEICPWSTDKGFHSGGYYKFTECNRNELKDYMIKYRQPSSCLYDEPSPQTTFPWPGYGKTEKVISGEAFTPDVQCMGYYYGRSTGECPWKTLEVQNLNFGEECQLYCEMTDGSCEHWGKAIEGTPCGRGKSCLGDICTCVDQTFCSSTGIGSRPKNINYMPSVFEADRDTAVQICNSQQGSLAKILNKDTYDHLIGVISTHHQRNNRFHFDGRRFSYIGNDWRTLNGERLAFFTWEHGEPNNRDGNEECLYLWEEVMNFSDYACNSNAHYICQKDGKGECFTEALANDYRGMKSTTKQGYTCLKWTEHSYPKTPEAFPNRGLGDHNYCRNPDVDSGGAWCYISGGSIHYDYCDVGQPQQTCGGKDECYQDANGYDYRGKLSQTISGHTCQKWTAQTPQQHYSTPENYPNRGIGDHNYCRNPDNGDVGPWCFTVDGPRWKHCDVGKPGDCEKLGQNMHGKMVRLGETSTLVSTKPFLDSISEITVSFWVRSSGSDSGLPFMYSSPTIQDEFSVRSIGSMHMYVHGIAGGASYCGVNDGFWHHVTVTWQSLGGDFQFFKDGIMVSSGADLAKGFQIEAGGILVIGRGQLRMGDALPYNYIEGEMTSFNAWNRKLTAEEIQISARSCDGSMTGNLISWSSYDLGVQLSAPGSLPIEKADTCEDLLSRLDWKMIMFSGDITVESFTTIPKLTQLTACFWLQSTYSNGGWFTYQTRGQYAMALWYDTQLMVQSGHWNDVSTTVNDGKWHHLCVTWTSAGEWQVFKDGVKASNGAGHGTGFELAAGGRFILGAYGDYGVKGNMAFFNVWDRVMTDGEVTAVKNACDGNYEGNVLSWKRGIKSPPSQYTASVNLCVI
ncbi:uncharacterized protein [Ptychodera flava]|uniref:uncharacterized protein n=1 Tax=Ptychodera flava TaxID=63121 RepID=UPI00396A85BE